jgi:phosphohistidine phosphatase
MARRLLLMRHAKSSWDDPSLPDHERPLNGRGRRAARAIGAYLRANGLIPELVLCSTATRARQTLAETGLEPREVRERDDLYGAEEATLLAAIREAPDAAASVAVIAHDPGMHELATRLVGASDGRDADRIRDRFPTGAVAIFDVRTPWAEVPADVRLTGFVRPRDLS